MTCQWVDDAKPHGEIRDRRWVMRCDAIDPVSGARCPTVSDPPTAVQRPLAEYSALGWSVAMHIGDVCPDCLGEGVRATTMRHSSSSGTM